MSVYIVTWNLNKEAPNYKAVSSKLHDRLNTLTTIKHQALETVRFVSTTKTARELYEYLERDILDTDDKMVITSIRRGEYWGKLSREVWNWISEKL
jgi:hypothetical protein